MKTVVLKFTVILFVLAGGIFSCNKEDDNDFSGYESYETQNVRLVKKLTYLGARMVFERVYTYDNAGNMVKESLYDCESTKILLSYTEFEYSNNKKVKESFWGGIAGNPTLNFYILYFYEGVNVVKEEYYSGFNGELSLYDTRNYEYDEKGNLVRESWYGYYRGTTISGAGDLKYSYDEQNRLILKEETTAIDVNDSKYIKHIYDKSGREMKVEYYNINWDLLKYEDKIYKGTSKSPEEELHYDKNGNQTAKYQHVYDKWGNLTKTVLNDTWTLLNLKYYGGLLIEETHYQNSWGSWFETGMSKYKYEKL